MIIQKSKHDSLHTRWIDQFVWLSYSLISIFIQNDADYINLEQF